MAPTPLPSAEPPEAEALRPAWLTVDLDALSRNYRRLAERLRPSCCMAVVKANAYGHGAVEVGRTLAAEGIDWFGVAIVEEGAELRRAGVGTSILVLGPARESQLPFFARYRLTPAVSSLEQLALWRQWIGGGRTQELHLKVDTGMTRLGVGIDELGRALEMIRSTPGLVLAGLMSHLAEADEAASPRSGEQDRRFGEALAILRPEERARVVTHLANSAAALHDRVASQSLVRLGLALYGLDPARGANDLEPLMAASARIVQVREVPAGTRVGYGGRWRAKRPSRVAVVPVGYADGYCWRLGQDSGEALVRGRRVPLAGAVSMDMLALDITDSAAELGDEVVLLGRQGEAAISLFELADRAGTLPYEILCLLSQRLPRRYAAGGEWVAVRSRLIVGGRP